MPADLYSLLSPRLSPSLGQSALDSYANWQGNANRLEEQKRSSLVQEQEQNRSNVAREGLAQQGVDLQKQQQNWGRSKDQVAAFDQYIQLLNSGDVAGAEQLAQGMKAMGIQLTAAGQPQQQAPQAPPQATPQPPAEEGPDPQEMAEAAERIRSIGGDDSGFTASPPQQAAPQPQQAPQQQPRFQPIGSMMTLPQASTGPLPQIRVQFDGQDMGIVDPNKRVAQEKAYVQGEVGSRVGSLPSRFQPMATKAYEGVPNREALASRDKYWMNTENEMFAGERAQAQAEAMGARAGIGQREKSADDVRTLIAQEVRTAEPLKTRMRAADQAIKTASSNGNSLAQRSALTGYLQSMFKGATSDRELNFATRAAGRLTELEMQFNNYFQGGELPPDYLKLLSEASGIIKDATRGALERKAESAVDTVYNDPQLLESMGPEWVKQYAKIIYGRITESRIGPPPKGMGSGGGSSQVQVQGRRSTRGTDPFTGKPPAAPAKKVPEGLPDFLK